MAQTGTMAERVDIAVIGGGPAGAAVAMRAARAGASVAVFEKAGPGRDKVCGDGLTPRAVAALHELDIDLDDSHRIDGLRMIANKTRRELPWPATSVFGGHGAVWPRRRLDAALIKAAEELGANILWHHDAMPIVEEAGAENLFLFGLTAEQVASSRGWYDPHWHYEHHHTIGSVFRIVAPRRCAQRL